VLLEESPGISDEIYDERKADDVLFSVILRGFTISREGAENRVGT
jgi:hypothetical protein